MWTPSLATLLFRHVSCQQHPTHTANDDSPTSVLALFGFMELITTWSAVCILFIYCVFVSSHSSEWNFLGEQRSLAVCSLLYPQCLGPALNTHLTNVAKAKAIQRRLKPAHVGPSWVNDH
jgi:hypothetical protein